MIVVSGECMWVGFGMGMDDDDDGNKNKELMKSKTMSKRIKTLKNASMLET